ncbi:MAG: radical SAM family heme chaperone HemW [Planctomycetota bacterium]
MGGMIETVDALYVHVPFCLAKCSYCDFYSVPVRKDLVEGYLSALAGELAARPMERPPRTVYVGGGTPSSLPEEAFRRLLATIGAHIDRRRLAEWTVEANPATELAARLGWMREAGVTRVSIGAQSLSERTLAFLGRLHSGPEARRAALAVREAGLELSVDLITAVPGQSKEEAQRDLEALCEIAPGHASVYALSIEEGTPLKARVDAGEVTPLADDEAGERILLAHDVLTERGYEHYEISNFALPGRRCRHNLTYWRNEAYLGVGPAAVSYIGGKRFKNPPDIQRYCALVTQGWQKGEEETLGLAERARETLILGLRLLDGVSREEFEKRTGVPLERICGGRIDPLVKGGFLRSEGDVVALTRKALPVADAVLVELLLDDVSP